jgi:hypothetical protein
MLSEEEAKDFEFGRRSSESPKNLDGVRQTSNSEDECDVEECPVPELKFDQKCIKHNLLVHSYHVRRRVLLCT